MKWGRALGPRSANSLRPKRSSTRLYLWKSPICISVRALSLIDLVSTEKELENGAGLIFQPVLLNQVFRVDENIHGYKDLKIDLRFASGSLFPHLEIKYSEKQEGADDIEGYLLKLLEKGFSKDLLDFKETLKKEADFKPLGEEILSYSRKSDRTFKVSFSLYNNRRCSDRL